MCFLVTNTRLRPWDVLSVACLQLWRGFQESWHLLLFSQFYKTFKAREHQIVIAWDLDMIKNPDKLVALFKVDRGLPLSYVFPPEAARCLFSVRAEARVSGNESYFYDILNLGGRAPSASVI